MSYDLLFGQQTEQPSFSWGDFQRYFGERAYTLSDRQALYESEDTEVYFSFDFHEPDTDLSASEEVPNAGAIPVAFNLNYFRPHVFGLEAEPEVAAFVNAFNLTVFDPQGEMESSEYSAEGFLRGWNAGNEFAYRAILSQGGDRELHSLPRDRIEAVWRWNHARQARQQAGDDAYFVPKIFFTAGPVVRTAAVWGDGMPILLPQVDLVLIARQELAPRRWFRAAPDVAVLTWPEAERLLRPFATIPGDPSERLLQYDQPPAQLEQALRALAPARERPEMLPTDQVLNSELLEAARGSQGRPSH